MFVSSDVAAQDKLARLPPAYKQLVNLIRLGQSDKACEKQLLERKMRFHPTQTVPIAEAVVAVANILGVPESTYEERRECLRILGLEFFGGGKAGHGTDSTMVSKASPLERQWPSAEEVAARIVQLSANERKKLEVCTDPSLSLEQKAKKLHIASASIGGAISKIYLKINMRAGTKSRDASSRDLRVREALALLSVSV